LLDEAMIAVTTGEVSPLAAGDVYCSVIEGCHEIFDVRRAQEWTEALMRWCAAENEPVPYRGRCRLHRAEILQLHGSWQDALEEAEQARSWLAGPPPSRAVGEAFYQLGDLQRLLGEFEAAETSYRNASAAGRLPQPGLALLRLAQGQTET